MTLKRRKPRPAKWKPPLLLPAPVRTKRRQCPCCWNDGVLEGPLVTNPLTGDLITHAVFTEDVMAMCGPCIQAAFLGGTHPHPMRNS